ncbi:MAG: alpha/beta hydrolase [Planctomycetota bacterium]|jgi:alpha/beta superfamily hydrolase
MKYRREKVTFPAAEDSLTLEGELMLPKDGEPEVCAVVCHPHPGLGGTMHNFVVAGIARFLCDAGYATLRFNFRSSGLPEEEGKGLDEALDVVGAIAFARSRGYERILLAGYSFGALMSLRACARGENPERVVFVALPTVLPFVNPVEFKAPALPMPALFVSGDSDEFSSLETISERFGDEGRFTYSLIERCDHFFGVQRAFEELKRNILEFLGALEK